VGNELNPPLVECRSSSVYAETPVALHWEGERLPVAAIEKHWREPAGPCFRVRTEDGLCFDLRYSETSDEWDVKQI
jgi:hypothetical protein